MSDKDPNVMVTTESSVMVAEAKSEAGMLSDAEAKKLLRRIDLHVLPMLFIVYFAAFLDRANISNALTMRMPKELHLTGKQPNIALAVFFVPYIIFEIPSNILMKKFTPHAWLAICIGGFGIVTMAQGFVKNYSQLLATRFFLGFFEAGIFPGSFYLISFWYKREESQKRFTIYFCSVIAASAFGGLMATGIAKMDKIGGLSNWRWIFILEGLLTIVISIMAFFAISDFPKEAKWLSDKERSFVLARTKAAESVSEKITSGDLARFFKDPKNYCGALMYFSVVVPVYAFAFFTPTIIKALGYSVIQTQLRSVTPFAAALGLCLVTAYLSDKIDKRLPFVLFGNIITVIGLAILITVHHRFPVQWAAICLVCMGALSAAPGVLCWYLMNLQGHKERSIGSGWVISFGNVGGIIAPFTFLAKDAPHYHTGYSIVIAVAVLGIVSTICYALLILLERRKVRDDGASKAQSFAF